MDYVLDRSSCSSGPRARVRKPNWLAVVGRTRHSEVLFGWLAASLVTVTAVFDKKRPSRDVVWRSVRKTWRTCVVQRKCRGKYRVHGPTARLRCELSVKTLGIFRRRSRLIVWTTEQLKRFDVKPRKYHRVVNNIPEPRQNWKCTEWIEFGVHTFVRLRPFWQSSFRAARNRAAVSTFRVINW